MAKHVNPQHPEALRTLETWKWAWWTATVKDGCGEDSIKTPKEAIGEPESIEKVLEEFGDVLIRLGEPIWRIQEALERAPFDRGFRR